MAYNPFYVQPGGDASVGLTGLADTLEEVRLKKQEQAQQNAMQEAYRNAWQSGDPSALMDVAIQYPELSATVNQSLGLMKDTQKQEATDFASQVLSNPEKAVEIATDRLTRLTEQGRNAENTQEFLRKYQADPKSAIKELEMTFAMSNPDSYKAWKSAMEEEKATPYTDIGKAKADLEKGLITQDEFMETIKKDPDTQIEEIYDPTSPTGTRFVARSEAIGKPGKPPSKMSFTVDPETGAISFEQGRDTGLEKKTSGTVEDKILKAGDTLAQITSIKSRMKPEFQEIGTRLGMSWNSLKDKLNPDSLNPKDKEKLNQFTQYRADAGQLFALTLKDLSGVAVNPTEFKRAENWLPNPGTGIFDGDSPTQLEAKVDRFEDFTRKALMKYSYIKRHGLTVNDVDVEEMPILMNQRGDELANKFESQGVPPEDIPRLVKMRLADEFGLVNY